MTLLLLGIHTISLFFIGLASILFLPFVLRNYSTITKCLYVLIPIGALGSFVRNLVVVDAAILKIDVSEVMMVLGVAFFLVSVVRKKAHDIFSFLKKSKIEKIHVVSVKTGRPAKASVTTLKIVPKIVKTTSRSKRSAAS